MARYPTWYTLRELQEFHWKKKKARHSGYVTAEEYFHYFTYGRHYVLGELLEPLRRVEELASRHWPKPNCPPNAKQVSNSEMLHRIEHDCNVSDCWTLIDCKEQDASYYDIASMFVDETLPKLANIAEPDEVRVVMYFN